MIESSTAPLCMVCKQPLQVKTLNNLPCPLSFASCKTCLTMINAISLPDVAPCPACLSPVYLIFGNDGYSAPLCSNPTCPEYRRIVDKKGREIALQYRNTHLSVAATDILFWNEIGNSDKVKAGYPAYTSLFNFVSQILENIK